MDAAFEDYLKTADLNQYEKINPNSRTISVNSKNFTMPEEQGKEQNPAKPEKDQVTNPTQPTTVKVDYNGGRWVYQQDNRSREVITKYRKRAVYFHDSSWNVPRDNCSMD